MLNKFKTFFSGLVQIELESADKARQEHGIHLATAALLMEMVRADFEDSEVERERVRELLIGHFGLTSAEADELQALGDAQARSASSLYEFTRLLDQELDSQQKTEILDMLWEVAFLDKRLDKYEEYLMRKVADLLHLSHSALIQSKHRIEAKMHNDQAAGH